LIYLLSHLLRRSYNDHGTVIGTTIYMSPQVMKGGMSEETGERDGYGRKADVWSLGVTLVEMSTAKPPFRNAAAAIYSVCVTKEFPKFPEEMSPVAHDFLSRCLTEEVRGRADCAELTVHPFCAEKVTTIAHSIAIVNTRVIANNRTLTQFDPSLVVISLLTGRRCLRKYSSAPTKISCFPLPWLAPRLGCPETCQVQLSLGTPRTTGRSRPTQH
jgi:serine/threonine protein kinase